MSRLSSCGRFSRTIFYQGPPVLYKLEETLRATSAEFSSRDSRGIQPRFTCAAKCGFLTDGWSRQLVKVQIYNAINAQASAKHWHFAGNRAVGTKCWQAVADHPLHRGTIFSTSSSLAWGHFIFDLKPKTTFLWNVHKTTVTVGL